MSNGSMQIVGPSGKPLEVTDRANMPIEIQDQYSNVVDRFVTRKLGVATLAASTVIDTRTLTLAAGHGFVVGNMIEIEDTLGHSYQSRVLTVVGDTITVTNPLHYAFTTAATVRRVSPDMNVDGSVTPVTFTCKPPAGVQWDINMLSINILDDTAMDDAKFGGIAAITNGVIFRTVNSEIMPIFTAIDNGCFIRHCDTESPYSDKAPAGVYGLNVKRKFNSQQGDGVARRIGVDSNSEFQIIVQDNLTGLTRFWAVLRGHRVED